MHDSLGNMVVYVYTFGQHFLGHRYIFCCKMALSVREQCRWFELELKTTELQSKWESVINKSDEFYSSNGSLDGVLEKNATAD